jgi:hypothetical protein
MRFDRWSDAVRASAYMQGEHGSVGEGTSTGKQIPRSAPKILTRGETCSAFLGMTAPYDFHLRWLGKDEDAEGRRG